MAGPKDATFRHYSGPVGKPTYELKMRPEDGETKVDTLRAFLPRCLCVMRPHSFFTTPR